jgi:hypothetical protein
VLPVQELADVPLVDLVLAEDGLRAASGGRGPGSSARVAHHIPQRPRRCLGRQPQQASPARPRARRWRGEGSARAGSAAGAPRAPSARRPACPRQRARRACLPACESCSAGCAAASPPPAQWDSAVEGRAAAGSDAARRPGLPRAPGRGGQWADAGGGRVQRSCADLTEVDQLRRGKGMRSRQRGRQRGRSGTRRRRGQCRAPSGQPGRVAPPRRPLCHHSLRGDWRRLREVP